MTVIDFVMPSLGADMDSGTITEWLIETGDSVNRGDIVAIVETDKADIDIEVWDSGTVTEIVIPVGELVAVGTALARLEIAGPIEQVAPALLPSLPAAETDADTETETETEVRREPSVDEQPTEAAPASVAIESMVEAPGRRREAEWASTVAASPLVRRLAVERGIELAEVRGSGPGGAIIARDLTAVRPEPKHPVSGPIARSATSLRSDEAKAVAPSDRMRRAIADLMTRSNREIPHYYLETEIDLEAPLAWLESSNAARSVGERILPAALLMKAVALALQKHPEFNGFWTADGFQAGDGVHLGVAVSLRGGGLVAPAIRRADQLTVAELMAALRDLVDRSRSGRLRASEMTDPTVTVTNLGDRGVEVVHGVIYRPQVALIGIGRVDSRAAVVDGTVVPRRRVTLSLAADHRASDGQRGARLLNTISRLLQEPEDL